MNIAVFADLHGRILLCFKLCARWQRETGEQIDLILQAGDMGVYPGQASMDSATLKHLRKDPTELGFSNDFMVERDDVRTIVEQLTCPMLFVRGNHEDHTWLDDLERQHDAAIFPVDVYQHIYCMKTGIPYRLETKEQSITVLGVGRIGPLPGEQNEQKPKYIQDYERERLYADTSLKCDILLSHDVPLDLISTNYGMEELRLILDAYTPTYHFHGHTEEPFTRRTDPNGKTQTIKLADLHWDTSTRHRALEPGAMGILRWDPQRVHQFELVEEDWLGNYTAKSWDKVT